MLLQRVDSVPKRMGRGRIVTFSRGMTIAIMPQAETPAQEQCNLIGMKFLMRKAIFEGQGLVSHEDPGIRSPIILRVATCSKIH